MNGNGIAPDGKPYDVPCNLTKKEGEVEVVQFIRPNGKQRKMFAHVGEEVAKKAEGLILSAEMLRTGEIILYARRKDQPEEEEQLAKAMNGPGENSPANVLVRLIEKVAGEGGDPK